MSQEARELFAAKLKGKNVLTPNLLRYGLSGGFAYELTEGTDMDRKPLYGVTVLERGSGFHRHDLSKCFWSLAEADAYIGGLK